MEFSKRIEEGICSLNLNKKLLNDTINALLKELKIAKDALEKADVINFSLKCYNADIELFKEEK